MTMPDLISAMEGAVLAYSAGQVTQPVRTVLEVGATGAIFALMPAALDGLPAVGAKLVTVWPRNHERGLPSHLATIVLLDPETGAIAALLDGRYITEARTAAVSAVSAKLLARHDAHVLAILGSGVQARSHFEAIRLVRDVTEVRVWSPTVAHREAFAREMATASGLPVRALTSPGAAVRGADLVVLATASRTPVLDDADIGAGAHVMAVGACRPDQREMPTALVARARVFVDARAGALQESGDLLIPIAEGVITAGHIVGELGEVVAGKAPGRLTGEDVTIFKSLGMAVEDVVAARLVVERARAGGVGLAFEVA